MNKKIKKFEAIKNKATNLQDKLNEQLRKFYEVMEQLQNDPEWKEYCKQKNICENFEFGDMLC